MISTTAPTKEFLDQWCEAHKKVIEKYDLLLSEVLAMLAKELAAYTMLVRELKTLASVE